MIIIGSEVIGMEGVLRGVGSLGRIRSSAALRKGLRDIARDISSRGRSNLRARLLSGQPKRENSGRLYKSITTRSKRRGPDALAGFYRASTGEAGSHHRAGNHAHLVDRGTKPRYTKSGKYTGIMPANRFWEDAKRQAGGRAHSVIYRSLAMFLEREVKSGRL